MFEVKYRERLSTTVHIWKICRTEAEARILLLNSLPGTKVIIEKITNK